MKHLQLYENFITNLFKNQKKEPVRQRYIPGLTVLKLNYQIGDIVKRNIDGKIGKILSHDSMINKNEEIEIAYLINFNDEGLYGYSQYDLSIPTDEEIEFFETTTKYNL